MGDETPTTTDLKPTTDRPSEPGYYWLREPDGEWVVVEVFAATALSRPEHLHVWWTGMEQHAAVRNMEPGCEWVGPIMQPAD